jgi:glutamate dehydrogenase
VGACYPLDLETDIQQPLLSVLDGWHDQFSVLADAVTTCRARQPAQDVRHAADRLRCRHKPSAAFHDLGAILRNTDPSRVNVRVEADNGSTTIRLYSVDRVPSLSTILPALQRRCRD